MSVRSGQPGINVEEYKLLPINLPTLPEQEKIATFLSAVDSSIEQLSKKEQLLRSYKKGVMQKIFSREIRFTPSTSSGNGKTENSVTEPVEVEDGGVFEDWVEKKLKDIATFYNGKAYTQKELLDKGKYRVLRVGNFFTNNHWYYSDLELDDNKYCDNGDLLYAWSASFGPRIWQGDKVIYHYHIWKVIPSKDITKDFLFTILDNETEQMKSQSANGFALLHITKGTIEEWKINLPSLPEQTKIANFLSSLDKQIAQVSEQLAEKKDFKKGLLQKMFV